MTQKHIWGCVAPALLAAFLASVAFAQNPPPQPGQRQNQTIPVPERLPTLPEKTPTPPEKVAVDNSTFLTKAIESNTAEVQLSQLAASNSQSERVKSFANMLVKDHSAALEKLKAVQGGNRDSKAGTVPLSAEHEKLKTKLQGLSGAQFDREFMDAMVTAHRASVGLFQQQAGPGPSSADKSITSSQVTATARELLPTIKHHLEQAEEIQKGLASPAK